MEGLSAADDIGSAKEYFNESDKTYKDIANAISSHDLTKLSPSSRADELFTLLVISLRKPGFLPSDKTKQDYLTSKKVSFITDRC
jgi:hypothetical protein